MDLRTGQFGTTLIQSQCNGSCCRPGGARGLPVGPTPLKTAQSTTHLTWGSGASQSRRRRSRADLKMNVPTGVPRQLTVATGEHGLIIVSFGEAYTGFFRNDFNSMQIRGLCFDHYLCPRGARFYGSRQKR